MKAKLLYFLIVLLFCVQQSAFAVRSLPDNNLSYPVLITLSDKSTASGFYLNSGDKYFLVTAKHVFFRIPPPKIDKKIEIPENKILPRNINKIRYNSYDKKIEFEGQMTQEELITLLNWSPNDILRKIIIEIYDESQYKLKATSAELLSYSANVKEIEQNIIEVNLSNLLSSNRLRYSINQDVAIIEIGEVTEEIKIKFIDVIVKSKSNSGFLSVKKDGLKKYDDVLIGNEVYVFGFPTSLGLKNIPQIDYKKPLLRKGIIAGINNNLKTIIIDCPIYFGNSGGPVIEVEQVSLSKINFKVIGIISRFVPFVEIINNVTQNYQNINVTNSGYAVVVPIDFILELIDKTTPNKSE